MLKLLFVIMAIPVIFCSQACVLPDCFTEAIEIKGFNNGQEIVIPSETEKNEINDLLIEVFKDSRQMPAFGVSLHKETIKAMKEGVWLQFKFNETKCYEELPFDTILIHVEKDTSGVNLIRGLDGVYDGRCFYFDLENNFNKLYDYLIQLETKEISPEFDSEIELESQELKETSLQTEESDNDKDKDESTNAEIPSVPHNKDDKPKVI